MSDTRPVVVVGGGTAGLAFIVEFVKHSDRTVILVEPGHVVENTESRRFFSAISEETTWPHRRAVLVEGEPEVSYLQARAIGGGSAINAMLNVAWPDENFDEYQCEIADDAIGLVGRALLASGGKKAPLSWRNSRRSNDVERVMGLIREGRIECITDQVVALREKGDAVDVVLDADSIDACHVVLAAGVFANAEILHKSTFPRDMRVGENISDHPSLTFTFPVTENDVTAFDASVYLPFEAIAGVSQSRALIIGYERVSGDDAENGMLSVVLMSPESRGWLDSGTGEAVAHLNMLSTPSDVLHMRQAVEKLIAVASHESFASVAPEMRCGPSGISLSALQNMSTEDLDNWIRQNLSPVSHISGGCNDPVLKKIDVLTVIDSSSLENVPDVLPNRIVAENAHNVGKILGEKFA